MVTNIRKQQGIVIVQLQREATQKEHREAKNGNKLSWWITTNLDAQALNHIKNPKQTRTHL